jgi:hypothetical protein
MKSSTFKPCPQSYIDNEAAATVKKPERKEGFYNSVLLFMLAFAMFVMGFVLLLIPVIGWILGPILIIGAMLLAFFCWVPGAFGFLKPANQRRLAGTKHHYRNMMQGNCPICDSLINIMPTKDTGTLNCPSCKQLLQFHGTTVTPK